MVDKVKKTPDEIRAEILNQLKNGPKTIAEIGEAINSNWLTIEKFLKELKEEGIVFEVVSSPKMKIYRSTEDLAYYSLPFSDEIRNNSSSLLYAIAEKWKKETGVIPSRTMLQKVAVELIEQSEGKIKEIPILRFHYGQTLAVRYDESSSIHCKPFNLNESQITFLKSLIKKYHGKFCKDAKSAQYKKPGMELYKEKEDNLVKGFSCFSQENKEKIEKSLLKLSIFYPIELKNSFPLFDKFIYCSTSLLNLKDPEAKKEGFSKIRELFSLVWDAITSEYFFYDAEKHILPEKKELFYLIRDSILNLKFASLNSLISDLESEVNSINPDEIESLSDKESLEIRQLFVEGAGEG